jgi:hypothetical protein
MKKISPLLLQFVFCCSLLFLGNRSLAQTNTYNIYIKNINFVDCKNLEFEMWLEWTGTNTNKLTFFQAGINFNYNGLANGGTMTGAFVTGSADPSLPAVQQTPNWNLNASSKQIRMLASIATPSSIATAIPPPPGVRLGKFRITNTADFNAGATPNFTWSFAVGTSSTTQSRIAFYLSNAVTGTDVTVQASHLVESNPASSLQCGIICNFSADITQTNPPVCLGGNNGAAQVTLSGTDATSTGTYSLDGGPNSPYSSNPFIISGLSAGNHTVVVRTPATCTSNTIQFAINPGADPNDNNLCTIDNCDPVTGVVHFPINIDDANICTNDICNTATGSITHSQIDRSDNNPCTFDGCDPVNGIYHFPLDVSDGNACTNDNCDQFTGIISHTLINTDDGNKCTDDGCNAITGIFHTPVNKDDNNLCTIDLCDADFGILHVSINTNDDNACTIDGCDSFSGQIIHQSLSTDDGIPCTVDACNSLTGVITHIDVQILLTVTLDPILCYGQTTCVNILVSGGTPPYSGDGTICGVQAGDYSFIVTDAAGCSVTSTVQIDQPDKLALSVSSTPANCSSNDGTATVSETGGTFPITCIWYPVAQIGHTAINLAPGLYTVICTDVNGCTASASVIVGANAVNGNPSPIHGPDGACRKQTGVVYCTDSSPIPTTYVWTLPEGVVATGPSNGPCITLKFTSKFKGGFLCVRKNSACGLTDASCKNISLIIAKPYTPGNISGATVLCPNINATYSVPIVSNATSYEWTTSGNISIVSGQGTNVIEVHTAPNWNSGSVKVKSINCKGISGIRTLNISKQQGCRVAIAEATTMNSDYIISDLILFPNPAHTNATLSFVSIEKNKYIITISDYSGRILSIKNGYTAEGSNQVNISLEDFSKGIYFVTIQTEGDKIIPLRLVIE